MFLHQFVSQSMLRSDLLDPDPDWKRRGVLPETLRSQLRCNYLHIQLDFRMAPTKGRQTYCKN
jgi:hypothetical protein